MAGLTRQELKALFDEYDTAGTDRETKAADRREKRQAVADTITRHEEELAAVTAKADAAHSAYVESAEREATLEDAYEAAVTEHEPPAREE